MRATAFCTLPLKCVDIPNRIVHQYPSLGVKTKLLKGRDTVLLDIPELLAVVQAWDDRLRGEFEEDYLWYPVIGSNLGIPELTKNHPGKYRRATLAKNLNKLFDRTGIPRMSPHKFRRGHKVFLDARSTSAADMIAGRMNLMHEGDGTSEKYYGELTISDMHSRITRMSRRIINEEQLFANGNNSEELVRQISASVTAEVLRNLRVSAN